MIDEETKQIVAEQEQMKAMIESTGWQVAKKKLGEKLSHFTAIQTLIVDGRKPDEVVAEIGNRLAVVDIVWKWIEELEGMASMSDNASSLKDDDDSEMIKRS